MVVGNVVGRDGVGFGADMADAVMVTPDGPVEIGKITKAELANRILDWLGDAWGRR